MRFTLQAVLGSGSFATVYRAEDTQLRRSVAIKCLHPVLAVHPTFVERFLAEARAVARLRHPHIVTLHEVAETPDGQPYLVMELLEGIPLSQVIRERAPLPMPEAVHGLTQLASALDYLHSEGIVHRDLKPSNVMVGQRGDFTLMDFGIARSLTDEQRVTVPGQLLGTPAYMAPEQFRGEPVGPAADIYSLGILAYELFAGRPPFTGSTEAVTGAHLQTQPPSLTRFNPDVAASVVQATEVALAKDPAARPQTAMTFVRGLTDGTPGTPDTPLARSTPRAPRRARKTTLPAGVVTLLYTDIEGGSLLAQRLGDAADAVFQECFGLLRSVWAPYGGQEAYEAGDGIFVAFARPSEAVAAAAAAQQAVMAHSWTEVASLRVRIGVHTGQPRLVGTRYAAGPDLYRLVQVCEAAHGGQVLLSQTTASLVQDRLPEGTHVRDVGEHQLRSASRPERLFQLIIPGLLADFPPQRVAEPERILVTLLYTDLVASTARVAELGDRRWRELLLQHHGVVRSQLARFRGRELDTAGDGFFASFESPTRAMRCADAIHLALQALGLTARAGLHTGECEVVGEKVGGIAVHIGARVLAAAGAGEILVSSTVKDLVAGADFRFEDRGVHVLKGVPGEWQLFAVQVRTAESTA